MASGAGPGPADATAGWSGSKGKVLSPDPPTNVSSELLADYTCFEGRIPVCCHGQTRHGRSPAAMLCCWWHDIAGHVGAMA